MTIWLTSDTHFNHKNICGPELTQWGTGFRNFGSLEQMNNIIINNINTFVKEDDILYHLGDFAFGDKKKIPELRSRIACRDIRFIYGNHDERIRENEEYQRLFTWCKDYYEFFHQGLLISLMHYPLGSWNGIGKGGINCHGHCHNKYERTIGRQIDVGVDAQDFQPVNLDELVRKMRKIDPILVDHHDANSNLY